MSNEMSEKFGIRVISNACGVLPHTVRAWEQRYSIFKPERSSNGQRLYDNQDLNKARLIAKLLNQGHSISRLAHHCYSELELMLKKESTPNDKSDFLEHQNINKKLLLALSSYEIDEVLAELQHLRISFGAKEFIFNTILPTMRTVGKLVQKGKYSVTQEHIISTIIRDQLSQIYLPSLGAKSKEVALATPEGNLHELAIIIADIICRANRFPTRYLGAAHPAQSLAEALNILKCPTLVLGALSSDKWDYENHIIPYLQLIDQSINYKLKVIIGGGFELNFPDFLNIKEIFVAKSFHSFQNYLNEHDL